MAVLVDVHGSSAYPPPSMGTTAVHHYQCLGNRLRGRSRSARLVRSDVDPPACRRDVPPLLSAGGERRSGPPRRAQHAADMAYPSIPGSSLRDPKGHTREPGNSSNPCRRHDGEAQGHVPSDTRKSVCCRTCGRSRCAQRVAAFSGLTPNACICRSARASRRSHRAIGTISSSAALCAGTVDMCATRRLGPRDPGDVSELEYRSSHPIMAGR
jgi:hypothetical protein